MQQKKLKIHVSIPRKNWNNATEKVTTYLEEETFKTAYYVIPYNYAFYCSGYTFVKRDKQLIYNNFWLVGNFECLAFCIFQKYKVPWRNMPHVGAGSN